MSSASLPPSCKHSRPSGDPREAELYMQCLQLVFGPDHACVPNALLSPLNRCCYSGEDAGVHGCTERGIQSLVGRKDGPYAL